MRIWPRTLGMRLLAAFALAVLGVIVLAYSVERWDRRPIPTKRPSYDAANAMAPDGDSLPAVRAQPTGSDDASTPLADDAAAAILQAIGFRLLPTTGTIMLVQRQASLSPDIVPVIEILASGRLVTRRPMPLAVGPLQVAPLSREGHGAGIVLPVADLRDLTPASRAALLGLLQCWLQERPIPSDKLRSNDLDLPSAAVVKLLSWVP